MCPLARWLCIGVLFLVTPAISRASMSWSLPTAISADANVSTLGTLVAANSIQGSSSGGTITVNGVGFVSFQFPGSQQNDVVANDPTGHFTATPETGTSLFGLALQLSSQTPFANLSPSYRILFGYAGSNLFPTSSFTLSIGGLTPGHAYQFQWWTEDSNNSSPSAITASDSTSVLLDGNTTDADGGLGQYAVGTFVASATPESVVFSGTNREYVNAYQLRDITSVPEPATWSMLLGGLGLLLAVRRLGRKRGVSAR